VVDDPDLAVVLPVFFLRALIARGRGRAGRRSRCVRCLGSKHSAPQCRGHC